MPEEEPVKDLDSLFQLLDLLSFSLDFSLESDEPEELPLEAELDDNDVEPLVWHVFSDLHSQ